MAWSRLQAAAAGATAATSVGATYGTNLSSGSKLIAFVVTVSTSATITSVKDGAGNTFTAAATATSGSPSGQVLGQLFFLDTPAGDVGTKPTITATIATSTDAAISIAEVSGLLAGNTTACLDGSPVGSAVLTTATTNQPSYTSNAASEFLAVCFGDNGGAQTYTGPAGYTVDESGITGTSNGGINGNSSNDVVIGFKNSTGGAETGAWTFTGTFTGSVFIVVAFKLAAGGSPAYPFREIVRRQAWPRAFLRRSHVMLVVPAQVNPPYQFSEIVQHRQTWPRGFARRGRQVTPVPPQVNPPYPWAEVTQHRQTWPRGFGRRGRQWTTVPPQVNPPYPFAEIRQWRQPRGFWPRRGHQFTPVPAQQSATPNPAITFQNARHQRVLFQRRGRIFTPVPGQHHPETVLVQRRQEWPRGLPRRGRQAQPVPAQVTVANPAWVQGHRSPLRAIALIRRRWHDLFPWPQATVPVLQNAVSHPVVTQTNTATPAVTEPRGSASVVAATISAVPAVTAGTISSSTVTEKAAAVPTVSGG